MSAPPALAPSVSSLISSLLPWLSMSRSSSLFVSGRSTPERPSSPALSSSGPHSDSTLPPPHPPRNVKHPSFPPGSTASELRPTPHWDPHVDAPRVQDSKHFAFNPKFHFFESCGVELGDDYLVLPSDVFVFAPAPRLLKFMCNDDPPAYPVFDLVLLDTSVDQVFPGPDTTSPFTWHVDQTLSFKFSIGRVIFQDDY